MINDEYVQNRLSCYVLGVLSCSEMSVMLRDACNAFSSLIALVIKLPIQCEMTIGVDILVLFLTLVERP